MSQIQVIGREAVDDTNNIRDNAQKQAELQATIADKRATLNYYAQELEYKKKVAIDDVKKAMLTDKMEKAKLLLKVFDDAAKSPNPQQYLANVSKMNIDLVSDTLGDPEFQKLAGKMQPSGEEQYKQASANAINFPNGKPAQVGALQGDIPGNQPVQDQGAGGSVNAAPIAAMNQGAPQNAGHWVKDVAGPSGVTSKWIADNAGQNEIDLAVRKQAALDQVAMEKDIAPIRTHVNKYLQTFDAAVGEIGGLESNALAALAKGKFNEAAAQVGDKPNVFALGQMVKSVGLALGSFLNRGRPTEPDAIAAEKMLTRLTYTKGVNIILRDYLNDVVKNGDKEKAADLYWYLAYKGGSTTADAKMYGKNAINPLAEKPFTIRVKKGQ